MAIRGARAATPRDHIIETPMMDRFSGGTSERRTGVIAQEPVGTGKPEEITAAVLPVLGPSRIPRWGSPPSYSASNTALPR